MIQLRRALPWMASLAAHAVLLMIPIRLAWQPIVERRIEIDLALQVAATAAQGGVATAAQGAATTPQGAAPGSQQRATGQTVTATRPASVPPERRAAPPAAAPPPHAAASGAAATAAAPVIQQGAAGTPPQQSAHGTSDAAVLPPPAARESLPLEGQAPARTAPAVVAPVAQAPAQALPPVATPNPADVLADLAGSSGAASAPAAGSSGMQSGSAAGDRLFGSTGSPQSQIGWETDARRLIRKRDPQFPLILSSEGQEVECDARIAVSPAGTVTRVEIIRSSGYTEIDASVEAALRDYLFSRVDSRKDAVGTVRFRFRLEKRD